MMLELVHAWSTQPVGGRTGFVTVHRSPELPNHVVSWLEARSGMQTDDDGNPCPHWAHRVHRFGNAAWSVLTSVVPADGPDATRSGKVASHILIRSDERFAGPAALLASMLMRREWGDGGPTPLAMNPTMDPPPTLQAAANWATTMAGRISSQQRLVLACGPEASPLQSLGAIEAAMPEADRWSWTFAAGRPGVHDDVAVLALSPQDRTDGLAVTPLAFDTPPSQAPLETSSPSQIDPLELQFVRLDPPERRITAFLITTIIVIATVVGIWWAIGGAP